MADWSYKEHANRDGCQLHPQAIKYLVNKFFKYIAAAPQEKRQDLIRGIVDQEARHQDMLNDGWEFVGGCYFAKPVGRPWKPEPSQEFDKSTLAFLHSKGVWYDRMREYS